MDFNGDGTASYEEFGVQRGAGPPSMLLASSALDASNDAILEVTWNAPTSGNPGRARGLPVPLQLRRGRHLESQTGPAPRRTPTGWTPPRRPSRSPPRWPTRYVIEVRALLRRAAPDQ